jgi:hypothetical protein
MMLNNDANFCRIDFDALGKRAELVAFSVRTPLRA